MGNSTLFTRTSDVSVSLKTHPNNADWITAHAAGTGLSVVEIERLWIRFKQLGCNSDGVLTDEILKNRELTIGEDPFSRNIATKLKNVATPNGVVYFQTFINAMYWFEIATTDEKLRACFGLLNNGRPWNRTMAEQVMSKVFPNDTEQGYKRISNALFQVLGQLDETTNEIVINEEGFVNFCVEQFPESLLYNLLNFTIIPESLSEMARQEMRTAKTPTVIKPLSVNKGPLDLFETSHDLLTDAQLVEVAKYVSKYDYRLLGNKLGYFESDMDHVENLYPGDKHQQVLYLLKEWRRKEGNRAYLITLQKILQESHFEQLAITLIAPVEKK